MEQKRRITEEAGLVTRVDEKFVYVWWRKQHLDELIFNRYANPEITCGDIVTFEITEPLSEIQSDAKLTMLSNHCFTIHIPEDSKSKCWVRTNVILPPEGSTYFAEEEKYCKKGGFMAFSKEFGKVACCIPVEHKPDTVYSCLVGRIPTKFDAKLKHKLGTIFCITAHGIKENNNIDEIAEIRKCVPWDRELIISKSGQADEWVKGQIQQGEKKNPSVSVSSIEVSNAKPIFELPSLDATTLSKESQMCYSVVPSMLNSGPVSPASASMMSVSTKPKVIQWVEEDEGDLNSMSVDCLTKCLGLKLPEKADPISAEERSEEPNFLLQETAIFSGLPIMQNTLKVEEEDFHGRNFDVVWDVYKKLRDKGLFLEAATLKKRSLELCMEYEFLLAKYHI